MRTTAMVCTAQLTKARGLLALMSTNMVFIFTMKSGARVISGASERDHLGMRLKNTLGHILRPDKPTIKIPFVM